MNRLKKIMVMVIAFAVCVTTISIPAQAASSKNKKAHKAYQKQLKKDNKIYYCENGYLAYAYKDLNGDGIDELIVDSNFYGIIYTYKNGKVKELFTCGDIYAAKYYTKKKVLYWYVPEPFSGFSEGYYKFENNKYKLKCSSDGELDGRKEYRVNGKKKKAKAYKAYIKKLTKGDKAKSMKKLKWKKY